MPLPVEYHFALPVVGACAAAEAYLQEPTPRPFTEFFEEHGLHDPNAYEAFYAPADAAVHCTPEGEDPAEFFQFAEIEHNFKRLLNNANFDARLAYVFSAPFLKEREIEVSDMLPIMQNSKRLGHHIGSVGDEILCNVMPIANSRGEMFEAVSDANGTIQEVMLLRSVYRQFFAPHRSRERGCPLLAKVGATAATGKKVLYYDLYWEVSVKHAHGQLIREGRLK